MARIVVGVDGSEGSFVALQWAAEEARLRHARLEVVHAFTLPITGEIPIAPEVDVQMIATTQQELDEVLARVDTTGVEVDGQVVRGTAVSVLVERAQGADLLVVGSRGRGGFAGLLLGSVSQQTSQHTPCPIVIVPPRG